MEEMQKELKDLKTEVGRMLLVSMLGLVSLLSFGFGF